MVDRGLERVVMGQSRVSFVGGETGELVLAGYAVQDLVGRVSYESVAHLLLFDALPRDDPPESLRRELASRRTIDAAAQAVADALPPDCPPMDALRTMVSSLGRGAGYPPTIEEGLDLIAKAPTLLTRFYRRSRRLPPVEPSPEQGHVAHYLRSLTGQEPASERVRALEDYFILLADHGMNASTFALRVVVSTNSDLWSGATAALAALKGPAHGGAPSKVADMLDAIGTPDRARAWIQDVLDRHERIYGFGHRAYKVEDPRSVELKRIARSVASRERFELADAVERTALDLLARERPGRRLYTNVEFYSAVVLESVGVPRAYFTPTFALARTAGWVAHAREQAADNRLIRPDVEYVGAPRGRAWPRDAPT